MRIDVLTKEVILTEDEYKNLLATKQEQPVCEDLEVEIARISKNEHFDFSDWKAIARHFAQWQKEKDYKELTNRLHRSFKEGWIAHKNEIAKEAVIEGWIARNSKEFNNQLIFVPGDEPPCRMAKYWLAGFAWGYTVIPDDTYPDLKWEDEPQKVKLIIIKED